MPATIVAVDYAISKNDIGNGYHGEVGQVVPYQARLLLDAKNLIFIPADVDECCCALNADNLATHDVAENVLESYLWPLIRRRSDEANRLLRLAVSCRLLDTSKWIARRSKIPTKLIGPELLCLAVNCNGNYSVNLEELFEWLKSDCGAPLQEYRDAHERNIEHIAAINGDSEFLFWLLDKHIHRTLDARMTNSSR